jgi:hypothetical protein
MRDNSDFHPGQIKIESEFLRAIALGPAIKAIGPACQSGETAMDPSTARLRVGSLAAASANSEYLADLPSGPMNHARLQCGIDQPPHSKAAPPLRQSASHEYAPPTRDIAETNARSTRSPPTIWIPKTGSL